MSNLYQAMNATATTANGDKAFHSTLSKCLDMFFQAPASRGRNINHLFSAAMVEDKEVALRILLWLRDVRGGSGERQMVRDVLSEYANAYPSKESAVWIPQVMAKLPELGRWDDLLIFVGTRYESAAFEIIAMALANGDALCAKWMPRQGAVATKLRKHMGMKTPKEYRKFLVAHTKVVETLICAKNWQDIDFSKLPSQAAKRYQKLFSKWTPETYEAYKAKLISGEAKVNASAINPVEVTRGHDPVVVDAQWKSLPNYLEDTGERIIPVIDVSGSMGCPAGGVYKPGAATCMDVAISLGMYVAERNVGIFKDMFFTFDSNPRLMKIEGNSITDKVRWLRRAPWGGSTDLVKTFQTLLSVAKENNLPNEELPTKVIIFSDMQFNQACRNMSSFETIVELYKQSGYNMPQIVFWNINASGNFPVTYNQNGVALVGGFSPASIKGVLGGNLNPIQAMLDTIGSDRYKFN